MRRSARHLIRAAAAPHLREVLAAAARRFVCIIDDTKMVSTLGRFPLPIESFHGATLVAGS